MPDIWDLFQPTDENLLDQLSRDAGEWYITDNDFSGSLTFGDYMVYAGFINQIGLTNIPYSGKYCYFVYIHEISSASPYPPFTVTPAAGEPSLGAINNVELLSSGEFTWPTASFGRPNFVLFQDVVQHYPSGGSFIRDLLDSPTLVPFFYSQIDFTDPPNTFIDSSSAHNGNLTFLTYYPPGVSMNQNITFDHSVAEFDSSVVPRTWEVARNYSLNLDWIGYDATLGTTGDISGDGDYRISRRYGDLTVGAGNDYTTSIINNQDKCDNLVMTGGTLSVVDAFDIINTRTITGGTIEVTSAVLAADDFTQGGASIPKGIVNSGTGNAVEDNGSSSGIVITVI